MISTIHTYTDIHSHTNTHTHTHTRHTPHTHSHTHTQHLSLYTTQCHTGIKIIATEVLKGHVTKPGLLAVDGGRLKLTPDLALGDSLTPIVNDPGAVTLAAVDDFNRAINACVHAEKEYVRSVCTDSVFLDVM